MGRMLIIVVRPLLSSAKHVVNKRQVGGKEWIATIRIRYTIPRFKAIEIKSVAEDVGSALWIQSCNDGVVHVEGEDRTATVTGAFWHPRH